MDKKDKLELIRENYNNLWEALSDIGFDFEMRPEIIELDKEIAENDAWEIANND